MNNIINNVSFGANLNVYGNMPCKRINLQLATDFAQKTKDISGVLTLKEGLPDMITAEYNGESFDLIENCLNKANDEKVIKTLEKTLKYILEVIKFKKAYKYQDPTKEEAMAFVKRLNKIAGKNDAMSLNHDLYTDMWMSHFQH